MSNKKRRNREKQPETISLGLNESKANQPMVSELSEYNVSNESKTEFFAYLKNPSNFWIVGLVALFTLGALGAGLKYLDESAKQERASGGQNQSFLSKINPFTINPLPSPTPQLSKEYIYAGSRVLAVEDANASAALPADLAVWRPPSPSTPPAPPNPGVWYIMGPNGTIQVAQNWGISGDKTVQGDYDGDGKTDFSIFRPSANQWWILRSSDATYTTYNFGASGDIPAPADYDGDAKTDIALYQPSSGTWYIFQSSTSTMITPSLGTGSGFTPTPADYDGDGKADVSVWLNSNGTFYTIKSANNPSQSYTSVQYGLSGDVPVPGDYDGDGKADQSVWRPGTHLWYIKKSTDSSSNSYQFGIATDLPVQNDYDGDGRVDMALWRAVDSGGGDVGNWYIYKSSTSTIRQDHWGTAGDIPVPALYRR